MAKIKNDLKDDPLMPLRHSAEHVLHTAMQKLYPELKKVMGPPIEDGFYFDFDLEEKITAEDFPTIEAEMHRMIAANLPIVRKNVSVEEAKSLFKGNSYKLDTLEEIAQRGESVSIYITGAPENSYYDADLCAGPHVASTGAIKAIKLLSVAGAYYKGSEKNKMLQRIYATAFDSQKALDDYLANLEQAKKRDHRKLGKELDLFVFSDMVGKGLPLFTEYGAAIWRELERYIVDEEIKSGYKHVKTPTLAKTELYKTSGHYPYYANTMYPAMKVDEEELILRPMTCPHHFALFSDKLRSYKELPLRYGEIAGLYRYELSGTLTGLTRVRSFCLADSHNFIRKNQAVDEIKQVLALIKKVSGVLGLYEGTDYIYRLSLGDRANKKKYYDSPAEWEEAEDILRKVLLELDVPYYEAKDEAAFYGPKIDIQMFNVYKKEDTAFTVQYDFCLPKKFDLKFVNEEGRHEQPVVIHRSSIGALERVIGFLIERYAGAFPVWLAPVQVKVIPIAEKNNSYALGISNELVNRGFRSEVDLKADTMQAKIRTAQMAKVPYMLVVGDKEQNAGTVNVRVRTGETAGTMTIADFISKAGEKYLTKALDLW